MPVPGLSAPAACVLDLGAAAQSFSTLGPSVSVLPRATETIGRVLLAGGGVGRRLAGDKAGGIYACCCDPVGQNQVVV
jgi:hypothetical protein